MLCVSVYEISTLFQPNELKHPNKLDISSLLGPYTS